MHRHHLITRGQTVRALLAALVLLAGCMNGPDAAVTPEVDGRTAVAWLRTNANAVRSVQFDDTNYDDLQPLRAAIGNARVVMLGEATHGDGTAFRAKARLVRFLHEEMGFDVLAFEGGLYDMHAAWRNIRNGTPALGAVRESLFEIWTYSQEVQPLFEYVGQRANSARPLELAGFDSQFTGPLASGGTGASYITALEAYLASSGSPLVATPEWPAFRAVVDRIARQVYRRTRPDAAELASFQFGMPWLTVELARLHTASPSLESSRWRQLGDALDAQGRAWFVFWDRTPGTDYGTIRDSAMARNLHWLATAAYPGRKIVVWAANAHIATGVQRVLNTAGTAPLYGTSSPFIPMGEIARRLLPGQVYAIGFVAGGGRTGPARVREGEVPPPSTLAAPMAASWEWLFLQTGRPYLFLNLASTAPDAAWLRGPRIARPLGYVHGLASWDQVFDGLFFLADMQPATAAP
jgi:erythromycin esterase